MLGTMLGSLVGSVDGLVDGEELGTALGDIEGLLDGMALGVTEGDAQLGKNRLISNDNILLRSLKRSAVTSVTVGSSFM